MNSILIRLWRIARNAKPTIYVLLMLGPMFLRPLAFVKQPNQPQPFYARLPGLLGTPLVIAALVASLVQSVQELVFFVAASKSTISEPVDEVLFELHRTRPHWYWGAFISTLSIVYLFASLRWLYHSAMTRMLCRWWPTVRKPPFTFFVVNTSAWGLWLYLFCALIVYGLWQSNGDIEVFIGRYLDQSDQNVMGVLLVFLCLGGLMMLASKNSQVGMKALYGGSTLLCFGVDMSFIALLLGVAYSVQYLPF